MWTSKLGNRYPKEQIEKMDRAHHQALDRLRKEPSNARCAECGEGGTCWASVNLGVFVCLRCSDVHRALGTHISKVKGCTGTYLWGPDEVARMQAAGNAAAEREFGGACSAARPAADASKDERVELCRKKYEQRVWAPKASALKAPPLEPPATTAAAAEPAAARRRSDAGVVPRVGGQQTVDLVDFDAFFRSFEEERAPNVPPAAAAPSLPRLLAAGPEGAPQPKGAAAKASEAGSCPKTLDDFLGDVLSGCPAAVCVPASASVPVAAKLERSDSNSVWEDFGAW